MALLGLPTGLLAGLVALAGFTDFVVFAAAALVTFAVLANLELLAALVGLADLVGLAVEAGLAGDFARPADLALEEREDLGGIKECERNADDRKEAEEKRMGQIPQRSRDASLFAIRMVRSGKYFRSSESPWMCFCFFVATTLRP